MDARSIQDFKHFVAAISNKLAQSEKFFTLKLATRLTNAAKVHPEDHTIVQMASFLSRRAQAQGGQLITRAELQDVYSRLYTTNSKCASFLSDELSKKSDNLPQATQMTRSAQEGDVIDDIYSRYADQKLASELESAFNKSVAYKQYSPASASAAEEVVRRTVSDKVKVKAVDGREFAILVQATFQTPKGESQVLIPVEIVNEKALIPTVFLSQAGFTELTKDSLEKHIVSTAGKNFRVDAGRIFDVIKTAKFGAEPELDQVERAVMMLKARAGTPVSHSPNGIVYQEVDKLAPDVSVETAESQTFAEQLGSTAGVAEFKFGKQVIVTAKNMILSELSSFGYKAAQIKIASFKDDSVTYAVSVNGAGFKVPVKIEAGKIKHPSVVIANGNVEDFSKAGIKSAIGLNDQAASAAANGLDLMRPTDLIKEVEAAYAAGDLVRAGDAITALELTGDESAFRYAFATYTSALSGVKKAATAKPKTIKVGGNEVCAQTFLPLDKVYYDENGVAHAKHRENMEKTDDVSGAGFMNAKILMGL